MPGVPDWVVPRPRITKLIAQGTRWCPLTVLTAPAGAGKTMALAVWTAAQPGVVAWVGLDGHDNRPGTFWANVVAALRQSGVAVPPALPAARGRAGDHPFLIGLAAALAAQDPPVTLVLDDLHLLTAPQVLDGLDYVLRNVGPGLRLVVSARMDTLPLHRYRLAGELTEIRARDLAFTVAEAALLLARHGITLTADSLRVPHPANRGQLAASIVIDALAIGEIIEPRGGPCLAGEFAGMPRGRPWTGPQPHLVSAAVASSAGRPASSAAALDAAEATGRGAVELWPGHLDDAARVLQAGVAADTASGRPGEPADRLGHLALAEALRGRLWTPASATPGATTREATAHLRPRCDWLHLSRSGCRSPWSVAGSSRSCAVTLHWPAAEQNRGLPRGVRWLAHLG